MSSDEPAAQPEAELILDVRPEAEYLAGHLPGSVNIPLEELSNRIYELPAPDEAFKVFDSSPQRADEAAELLAARRRQVSIISASALLSGALEGGPARGRLWRPHALLHEAVGIAQERWGGLQGRSALDIACGSGRDAVFLAERGFAVEAWDILPDALEQCAALSRRNGVQVRTCCIDIEQEAWPEAIDNASFDLVSCFYFLHRALFPMIRRMVRPGGMVVYETFVEPQAEQFGRPRRAQFILKKNELAELFADWEMIRYREHLASPGKIAASLICRRP